MAVCASHFLCVWILISTAVFFSATSPLTFYVKPSEAASSVTCPAEPCHKFNNYASEQPQYFVNNSLFVFLPGVHQLNYRLHVENVSNIALLKLHGAAAQIVLAPLVNIAWFNSTNVTITGLEFLLSGESDDRYVFITLVFQSTTSSLSNLDIVGHGSLQSTAIRTDSSVVEINDITIFGAKSFFGAGLISYNSMIIFSGLNYFEANVATLGTGGSIYIQQSVVKFLGNVSFVNNSAISFVSHAMGGAIFCSNSTLSFSGTVLFHQNQAFSQQQFAFGGGIAVVDNSLLTFETSSGVVFTENYALFQGGAIVVINAELVIHGNILFEENSAELAGGAIRGESSRIVCNGTGGRIIFQNNSVRMIRQVSGSGGAISAGESELILSGSLKFIRNLAIQGGAIDLSFSSKLVLIEPLQVRFIENSASNYGGVFFYDDSFSLSHQCRLLTSQINFDISDCFIELNSTTNIELSFVNNTAGAAGTILYGGNLDICRLYVGGGIMDSCGNRVGGNYSNMAITTIQEISHIIDTDNVTSSISSDPLVLCFCADSHSDIQCSKQTIHTVRGKEFTLLAVTVGQNGGTVPSSVRTSLDNDIEIAAVQRIQPTGKTCSPITYRLSSSKNTTSLVLFPDGPCRDTGISRRVVTINFLPCPNGFMLDGSDCVCNKRLQRFTNSCSVDDNTIKRESSAFWMGVVLDDNETYEGLILHPTCPFDFCVDTPVFITLDNLDIQCNNNHSGILCGSCVSGYSIAFASLHCLPCSNAYLALILPFAFAGIALVAILLVLKLSVASGMINGLIFYANVIQVNHSIFFPHGDTNILTVFIAWLNLDLGIETCFFNGMDTYIFTWLQFIFPFYVWFLIGLIVVISHYSDKVARSLGSNPVATLATLFLLSYSKILRTIIVALSSTRLEYPESTFQMVWLYDGNIVFFQTPRHIVLGMFAVAILLVLFLPYTLLLITGHWLQAYSHKWKILAWLNELKPFMDAYHAPYRKETRYWTGFILLVRCALFFTFSFNILGNASVNLLAISSVTAGLGVFAWIFNQIYEKHINNLLEAFFILNLCILAVGTYHVRESDGNQAVLVNISVGISFVIFILIVIYHLFLPFRKLAVWKLIMAKTKMHYIFGRDEQDNEDTEDNIGEWNELQNSGILVKAPTTTTVQLREPLLEN